MTEDEQRDGGVLAGLPASRPQRRSRRRQGAAEEAPLATKKKAAAPRKKAVAAKATPKAKTGGARLAQPDQPLGTPPSPGRTPPEQPSGDGVVGTAVQAAGELAQIGLTAGRQIVRGALSRLPRP